MEDYALKRKIKALSDDGKEIEIAVLHFDFDALAPIDYRQCARIEAKLIGGTASMDIPLSKKASCEFRIACAWIAAVRGTKGLCVDDFDRISMQDVLNLEPYGLRFFGDLA